MTEKKLKYPEFIFSGIIISLLYNFFWLGFFIYLSNMYWSNIVFLVLLFLAAYLLIGQPLKDWLFLTIIDKYIYNSLWKITKIEKTIPKLNTLSDIYEFLPELVKDWRLIGIRFVFYHPTQKILLIPRKGKGKWINFKKQDSLEFLNYIKNNPWGQNTKDLPEDIKIDLYKKKLRCVVPVMYRDFLLGYMGFLNTLEKVPLKIAGQITKRMAIVLQNEVFKKRILPKIFLTKEINLAREIESYLSEFDEFNIDKYTISKLETSWQEKGFPAIFETNILNLTDNTTLSNTKSSVIFLLCKLSDDLRRAKAIQLFSAQGYFIGISNHEHNLNHIARKLQKILASQEKGGIKLEGFLVKAAEKEKLNIIPFGKSLSLKIDEKKERLPNSASLGSLETRVKHKSVKLTFTESLTFYIREHPLVKISAK
ncbi:MAG: hypothetical protein OEZ22_10490 [Spirochaetia bacterium]|nr:hypothetical protein [Spirochaetia bacterium]